MLEIIFVTILVLGALFGAYCIVECNAALRKRENDRVLKKYEKLYKDAQRRRSASEMAGMLMAIEHFRDKH